MKTMSPQQLLTVEEAAEALNLSPQRVRQFCAEGRIGTKIGWQWLITPEEVRLFGQLDRPAGRRKKKSEERNARHDKSLRPSEKKSASRRRN